MKSRSLWRATYSRPKVGLPMTRLLAAAHSAPRILVALAALAAAPLAQAVSTSSLYVQDGLLACWDGIENAGPGIHVASTNKWIDLVAGRAFTLNSVTVRDDRMVFAGSASSYGELNAADTAATFGSAQDGTLEVVFALDSPTTANKGQIVLNSSSASGHAMSAYNGNWVLVTCNESGEAHVAPAYLYTTGTATNSVSVRYSYSQGALPNVRVGGANLEKGNDIIYGWQGSTTVTTIGTRTNKANNHFKGGLYCIRVYSRQLTDAEIDANHAVDVLRFREGNNVAGILQVSCSARENCSTPSPAYGFETGVAAGATIPVSCGATPWTNATETAAYVCTGWKLYDEDGNLDSGGDETSFTYTHPAPAEYRRLEWQWALSEVKGTVTAGADGSVSPSGSAWLAVDTPVTVTATPDVGKSFLRWEGTLPAGVDARAASVTFTPTAPFEMRAVFYTMRDLYVATDGDDGTGDGSQAKPYATIAKAITEADTAIAGLSADMATIHIADGTYVEYNLNVTNAITIVGESGNRDAVIIDAKASNSNQRRAFTLNHAAATLSGVTVRNGYLWSLAGGNILIDASGGVVTNCVVLNGLGVGGGNISLKGASSLVVDCVVTNGTARWSQGGNIIASDGRVSRCFVAMGKVSNTDDKASGDSGNVYLGNSAVIENCLIMGGVTKRDKATYANGVYLAGSSRLVNCTIVNNRSDSCPNVPAVNAGASTVRVVNCVIYGNGGTVATEWGGANGACYINCAVAPDAEITGGTDNIATLTDAAFKDAYANDDYRLIAGSALVDAGCDPSSYASGCSPDPDGVARPSGTAWDIGCYEFDWSAASVSVSFNASAEKALIGETVTFTPQVFGSDGPFTFKWSFDDGAGDEISSAATMTHSFETAGLHYPTVSVSSDGGSTWAASFTTAVPVQTAPPVMWLDASNPSPAYPYATEATAATNLVDVLNVLTNAAGALAMDGVTAKVKPGTYVGKSYPEITVGLTILGVGARDEIVFDAKASRNNQGRVFTLNHADATLSGVTVMNGYLWDLVGGNILIDASGGVATNCVVLNGMGVGGGNISLKGASSLVVDCVVTNGSVRWSQGGNIIASDGRVSHCLVSAGKVNEPYEKTAGDSGNVYLGGSAIMENCLVMGGATAGNKATYANGVYLAGNSRMVNCTIVKNRSDSCPSVPAVNAGASTVRAVNCAIYDNGGTAAREWGGANADCFTNCAFAASAGYSGTASAVTNLTDAAFKDYANGDYRPAKGGALVNAGTKWADYLAYGATSEADLAGAARLSGRFLDIGCYEIASGIGFQLIVR